MPDTTVMSLTGAQKSAQLMRTALANSKLRLFKAGAFNPTNATPLAAFDDAEADFSGYTEVTIATFPAEFLFGSGYALSSQQRFDYNSGDGSVGNQIGGWYLVSAAGVLVEFGTFDPSRPVQGDGQVVFVTAVVPFGSGQVL